ncbi:MAG: hypothetical protein RL026_1986 [Pseudomonadota bacterium]
MSDALSLAERIELVERGYEYLLAYAAQGRQDDAGTEARLMLTGMHDALESLGPVARAALPQLAAGPVVAPWIDALERDAQVARGALALVLGCPRIGSLLVDNLNASVHLRALLTDLFLLDQALKSRS